MEDAKELNKYMAITPLGSMLLVIVSHYLGLFIEALIATFSSFKIENSTAFQ